MGNSFSVRVQRTYRNVLRFHVGSRTSSLVYVTLAAGLCLFLALLGYLRRDGARIQFVRATYNTGLSFENVDWQPTVLKITGLHFDPRRTDPDSNARSAPGRLFESLESAHVDALTVQWGWRFLPEPTQVTFEGVRPVLSVQKLMNTIDWLQTLPQGPSRNFAIVLTDCNPQLTDFLDANGRPLAVPTFAVTIGPEVNRRAAINLVLADTGVTEPLSLRVNYDGSGVTNIQARNWKITGDGWNWIRRALEKNAAARAWWMIGPDDQPATAWHAWARENDLAGGVNVTLAFAGGQDHFDSLSLQADISDLHWRTHSGTAPLRSVDIDGAVTMQAHYDHLRGGFQIDLGAGNELRCNFDPPAGTEPTPLPWEGWIERNPPINFLRLAGSYRYRPEFERTLEGTPLLFRPLPPSWRLLATNLFACTQIEGAELRLQMKNNAEAAIFFGQEEMHRYDASITVRGPRSGPAAGSSAQLNLHLRAPAQTPGDGAPAIAPVTFELTVNADRFPVPGRLDMIYTGRFRLERGAVTRRWLNDLLLNRNLDIHPYTVLPWLDPEQPNESLRVDAMYVEDGRLVAFGEHPFFVRNINAVANIHIKSLNPLSGWANFNEVTGAQTGFGDHVVEFGPEKLQGLMEFNLGYLTDEGRIDPWSDRANDMEPENLYAAYLHSTADPAQRWDLTFVLPWYMSRRRPARLAATHFPARLYPPGLEAGVGTLLDVREPIDWELSSWLEPAAIGEAGLAPAVLASLPGANVPAVARVTQMLARHGLPGSRLLIVRRSLKAKGIHIQTASQFDVEGLELPDVGDTKAYPYPRE